MSEAIDTTGTELEPGEMDHGFAAAIAAPTRPTALAVTPNVGASELVARLDVIREAMNTAMVEGVDYGVIPGTGSKPTLLKPGAEKLGVLFQLDVQLSNHKTWAGEHLTVEACATVFHAPTGIRLGYGEGMCTSREKKYGKRQQDRACPQCDAATIKRSKYPPRDQPQAEPGWYCFGKIGGCGANFGADDPRITGQVTGEVTNPDLPDTWNTVVKMAEKRARVDAVLAVTGASALFTQDVEDVVAPEPSGYGTPPPPAAKPPATRHPELRSLLRKHKVKAREIRALVREAGYEIADDGNVLDAVDGLSDVQAGTVAEILRRRPVPTGESDVTPAGAGDGFTHPPAGGDPVLGSDPEGDDQAEPPTLEGLAAS